MTQFPRQGEIVVCKITKVNPHSAYAHLIEYRLDGMVHISEVASGWVKDINKELREGQTVVAKVIRIEGNVISLSIKRVDDDQKKNKLRDYNREKKAEKMLEIASRKMKQTQKLDEIMAAIKDKLGSLYAVFDISIKNPEMLKETLSEKWIETIREIAEKNIQEKEYEFKAKLRLVTYEPDGISKIRNIMKAAEKSGFEVIYLSAPDYMFRFKAREAKKGGHEFERKLDEMAETAKKSGFFKEIKILK